MNLPAACVFDDAHCHVAFMTDPVSFAADACVAGSQVLSVTVTPDEYNSLSRRLAGARGAEAIFQAVGLHPWWVPSDSKGAEMLVNQLEVYLASTRFVGEVGLDFSVHHAKTHDQQLEAFERICSACGRQGDKVLSIHAVQAAAEALEVLERTGCLDSCRVIFHWFSGTSDDLVRARRRGVWFSVGERMLATRRGRAYVSQMPVEQVLLETDLPQIQVSQTSINVCPVPVACLFTEVYESLFRTAESIAMVRHKGDTPCVKRLQTLLS